MPGRGRSARRSAPPLPADAAELARLGMPAEITMRHRTPHFTHVFSGDGYSAGYYSYSWAEVLSADAYAAFEESDDVKATGKRFWQEVLAVGGSRSAMESFKAFRGREPQIDALLRHSGFDADAA